MEGQDETVKLSKSSSDRGQRPCSEVTNPGKSTLARTQKSHAPAPGGAPEARHYLCNTFSLHCLDGCYKCTYIQMHTHICAWIHIHVNTNTYRNIQYMWYKHKLEPKVARPKPPVACERHAITNYHSAVHWCYIWWLKITLHIQIHMYTSSYGFEHLHKKMYMYMPKVALVAFETHATVPCKCRCKCK